MMIIQWYTLFIPIRSVVCMICRCRFDISTLSPSMRPIIPTPAPAKYNAAGAPMPPAPTMSTLALWMSIYPWYDISGNII